MVGRHLYNFRPEVIGWVPFKIVKYCDVATPATMTVEVLPNPDEWFFRHLFALAVIKNRYIMLSGGQC